MRSTWNSSRFPMRVKELKKHEDKEQGKTKHVLLRRVVRPLFSSIAIELNFKSDMYILYTGSLTVGVTGKSFCHFLDLVRSRSN